MVNIIINVKYHYYIIIKIRKYCSFFSIVDCTKEQRMPSKFKCLARRLFVVLSCIHIMIDWLTNYILYN